ncbi:hypothetical protein [Streptomyces niveus]|uniref:hypothetical protein n=1 Tax=Streptomyces niveus TaxID=193462 RepID=UPI003431E075
MTLMTAPDVAGALLGYGSTRTAGPPVGPVLLRERVEEAWRTWQKSDQRFTEIEEALPVLIADVEHSVRAYRSSSDKSARRDVLRVAADFYGLMRSYCRRSGRLDLSLMVADRARRAAEDADDPIRIAAAHWNLGHCLLSQDGGAQEAHDVAGVAIGELLCRHDLGDPPALVPVGACHEVALPVEVGLPQGVGVVLPEGEERLPGPAGRRPAERRCQPGTLYIVDRWGSDPNPSTVKIATV